MLFMVVCSLCSTSSPFDRVSIQLPALCCGVDSQLRLSLNT